MIIDFDKYSLIVDGKRLQVRSAAMHYFRLPDAGMWKDRLSKIKAGGYNTVDLYFCWGYHSSQPGHYDFTGNKDIRALLDITAELGLYVIARPGPYINAELSAGGLPAWLFNVPDVVIRNRKDGEFVYSEPYMQAVRQWYSRVIPVINEYHNVIAMQIENEYSTDEAEPDYIQELHDFVRELGVRVPLFHNDAFCACLYSDIVNIYACDTYPSINIKFNWHDNPDAFATLDNLEANLRDGGVISPLFIAELQAGWFDKWGGNGHEEIRKQFGKEHINIVTKTALSQGLTMFNHYMGCGGTNWDKLACSEVYTSYDFAAPISETGIPQENYYKAKEINYFLQAYDLASTDLIEDNGSYPDNVFVKVRFDCENNCNWLFVRNLNHEKQEFSVLEKYNINLKPFDMKILPVDLKLFACEIDFSSLSIFSRIEDGNKEIVFMLLDENSELNISGYGRFKLHEGIITEEKENKIKIKFDNIEGKDFLSCDFYKGEKHTKFIFIQEKTADKTWLINNSAVIGPEILTYYPYKAGFSNSNELRVIDFNEEVIEKVDNSVKVEAPILGKWSYYNCAPEIDPDFDYSDWNIVAEGGLDCISNRIYDEFIFYKTSFHGVIEQVEISAKHCFAAYLNGVQIFSHDSYHFEYGKELSETLSFNIERDLIKKNEKNELTVLVQNMGFDKGFESNPDLPRGILSFKTIPEKNLEWRIRGGLTPDIEEWNAVSVDNIENSSANSYLTWALSCFKIDLPEQVYCPLALNLENPPFDRASIFLNGNLIGHYWKNQGPQFKFYLIDGFLKQNNLLSLLIWNKNSQIISDYRFLDKNVNINIEIIKHYNLVNL